jgi:hypothetical protein
MVAMILVWARVIAPLAKASSVAVADARDRVSPRRARSGTVRQTVFLA